MGDKRKSTALANWIPVIFRGKSWMATSAVCWVLASCTAPHSPARDGVWIVNSTPLVRCEQTAEGVVCKSIRTIPADDIGI